MYFAATGAQLTNINKIWFTIVRATPILPGLVTLSATERFMLFVFTLLLHCIYLTASCYVIVPHYSGIQNMYKGNFTLILAYTPIKLVRCIELRVIKFSLRTNWDIVPLSYYTFLDPEIKECAPCI